MEFSRWQPGVAADNVSDLDGARAPAQAHHDGRQRALCQPLCHPVWRRAGLVCVWGCSAGICVVFWKDLGGKNGIIKLVKKDINAMIYVFLILYFFNFEVF